MTAQNYFAESLRDTHTIFRMTPAGAHARVSVDTIQTITAPVGGSILLIQAEGGTVRYTFDGTNPTATLGFRLGTADGERRIDLAGTQPSIKVVGEAAGFFVNVQWFRPVV
jgi:hypothetical protein